ncbi:flagellin N-terminal helical domain-containing protein [Hyphococcus sp.]|uniref:flagellin N-terminal helical domain-containing protein n=1 Tax=Hyphococcus sp. TaxID=2038636 RepID=UPI0035C71991
MTNSLLTNTSAMIALQNLRTVNKGLNMVQEQISTGKKVSTAKDNAAIFAISTVMQSDVKGFEAINQSLNLGSASVGVARGAAEKVSELLVEMKGLIVAAQEDNVDRTKIQTDIGQLRDQIDGIVEAAQFNGLNFLKGADSTDFLASLDRDSSGNVTASTISVDAYSLETTAGAAVVGLDTTGTTGVNGAGDSAAALIADTNDFEIHVDTGATFTEGDVWELRIDGRKINYTVAAGADHDDVAAGLESAIDAAGITGISVALAGGGAADAEVIITNGTGGAVGFEVTVTDGAGGGLANLNGLDVSTAAGAAAALVSIEGLIQESVDASAEFGSAQKRIEIQNEFVSELTDSLKTGIGALTDADLEAASARLQSLQVQQQLGIQALSIANAAPNSILGLFR